VAVGVFLAVGVSLAAMLLATARIVRTNAVDRATDDLQATRVAFYHLVERREYFGASQLRLVAQLPVFRAVLTDARLATDANTIYEMADEYRKLLSAGFSIVTNPSGEWLASPGWTQAGAIPPELAK
jgi:methylthioribose-1-phosphate isomerase